MLSWRAATEKWAIALCVFYKVTEDLKSKLSKLKAVIEKPNVKEDAMFDRHGNQISQRVEQPCIVFMTKQFERILVKYVS